METLEVFLVFYVYENFLKILDFLQKKSRLLVYLLRILR